MLDTVRDCRQQGYPSKGRVITDTKLGYAVVSD